MRLLVQPGQLFAGWDGSGPLITRFKTSVKNSIINPVQKRQARKRNIPAMSIHGGEEAVFDIPAPQSMAQTLLDEFREFLRDQHGEQAVQATKSQLEHAMKRHVLAQGQLMGIYQR